MDSIALRFLDRLSVNKEGFHWGMENHGVTVCHDEAKRYPDDQWDQGLVFVVYMLYRLDPHASRYIRPFILCPLRELELWSYLSALIIFISPVS